MLHLMNSFFVYLSQHNYVQRLSWMNFTLASVVGQNHQK